MLIYNAIKKYRHPEHLPKVALALVVVSLALNAYLFYSVWNVQYQNLRSQQARIDAEVERRAVLQGYIAELRSCIDQNISPCPKTLPIGGATNLPTPNY